MRGPLGTLCAREPGPKEQVPDRGPPVLQSVLNFSVWSERRASAAVHKDEGLGGQENLI